MELGSLTATDVVRRAIPWTLQWLEHGRAQTDLNFSYDQRFAAIVSVALVFSIPLALVSPYLWFVVGPLLVVAYRL